MKDAFYTSVDRHGNAIRFRGYINGKRKKANIEYKPTFFLPANKGEITPIKSLQGESLKKYNPGTMRDCDKFIRKYKEFSNSSVYGNERYENQFIADHFRDAGMYWDRDLINVTTIDLSLIHI